MRKLSRLAALLVAGAIISASAIAADKGQAFATVNGQPIPQNTYDAFVAEQKAQGAPDSPELKNAVKEELVRRELLAQEAKKKGLDKKPEVQGQIELAKQAVLIRAFLADYVRANPITEERLKKDYEGIKAGLGNTEYKARHILVATEDEAKAIIAKLDKGEKFSAFPPRRNSLTGRRLSRRFSTISPASPDLKRRSPSSPSCRCRSFPTPNGPPSNASRACSSSPPANSGWSSRRPARSISSRLPPAPGRHWAKTRRRPTSPRRSTTASATCWSTSSRTPAPARSNCSKG
jgi:hypothetical protein